MQTLTDRALILRRHPYSESSLIVSALTREHGLVQILARGAYRPRSQFYCVLDFFHELELEWAPSARSELGALRRGDVVRLRRPITRSLKAFTCANGLLELAGLGARAGHRERRLFDELSAALDALCGATAGGERVGIEFELAFLRLHGLFPALERCAACAQPAPARGEPPRVGFSALAGGRMCEACANEARATGGRVGTLPLDVLQAAASLARGAEPCTDPALLVRVRDFLDRFLACHLGLQPRSRRAFLAAENRNAPPAQLARGASGSTAPEN